VYTPHQYKHPGYDPHLWQGFKCYRKDTPETRGGVLRSWEVPPGLGREPGEEHGLIGENWGRDGVEMGFGRRGQERGEWR